MIKEECLDKVIGDTSEYLHYEMNQFQKLNAYEAMDLWAKQQSIAFMNWTLQSDCHYSCSDENQWTNINNSIDSITTEQLYELFIKQQP